MCTASVRTSVFTAFAVVLCFLFATCGFAQAQNPFFTPGNLVVSVEGNGVVGGTGTYGDNQAGPLTLFQYVPNGTSSVSFVNSMVLPQTASGANGPVSGEYGSSSEGSLSLAGTSQYLAIMGYGVNATSFNANPTLYGIPGGELGQSGSLTGQSYTPVPRVTALIDPYGNVNSSTAIFNIFNANNPRSTYTADGLHIYVSGQGTSGDDTGGVFYTTLGSGSATSITGGDANASETASQDTRGVQIYNNTLFVSMDSKSGSYNRSFIGTLGDPPATSVFTCTGVGAGCPTSTGTIGPAEMSGFGNTGGTGKETLTTGSNGNGNNLSAGLAINISPENFFFASSSVLYVADSGSPKNNSNVDTVCTNDGGGGSVGDGGVQKWVNSQSNGSGTWSLAYTLYKGLNLVLNTACDPSSTDGTTGLIGLTGVVNGTNVYLYATNYTIADLDPTYLYGITDTLSFTTASQASGETFVQLAAAPSDSNFKGVSFAPTLPAGSATITSSPSGLAFTSAGTGCALGTYTTPVTLIWTPGNSCTLSVVSPQTASGAQYTFAHWQDGNTSTTDDVTAPTTSAVYTAAFTTTTSMAVTSVSPAAESYGQDAPATITAVLSWAGNGPAPTATDVSIGGNGNGTYGVTSCGSPSGDTMTCTATYTPTIADTPGSYTETATFSGDSNYSGSTSAQTNNFSISSASAATTVACTPSPAAYGTSVTCTATINGQFNNLKGRVKSNVVTGNVAWSTNTGCGTTNITPGNPGTATCTTSVLPVGSDTVTGTYSGDSNHGGSAGSTSEVINQASQTITFTTNAPAEAYLSPGPGNQFTVAATASSGLTVAFAASGSCTVVDNGNGTATYTMSNMPTTACLVIANQAGNATYAAAPTVTQTVLIGQIWYDLSSPPNQPLTAVYGSNFYTVTGTTTSELPPTYTALGVCIVSPTTEQIVGGIPEWSATYTMTSGTGTCTIQVFVAGNSTWAAEQTISLLPVTTATKATNSVTLSDVPPSAEYGSSFMISASGLGTGAISYSSDGVVCTNLGATYTMISGTGNCSATATQAADSNYTSASNSGSVAAIPANSSVAVATSGSPSTYGSSVTFTATITSDTGDVKRHNQRKGNVKSSVIGGTVAWSSATRAAARPRHFGISGHGDVHYDQLPL